MSRLRDSNWKVDHFKRHLPRSDLPKPQNEMDQICRSDAHLLFQKKHIKKTHFEQIPRPIQGSRTQESRPGSDPYQRLIYPHGRRNCKNRTADAQLFFGDAAANFRSVDVTFLPMKTFP